MICRDNHNSLGRQSNFEQGHDIHPAGSFGYSCLLYQLAGASFLHSISAFDGLKVSQTMFTKLALGMRLCYGRAKVIIILDFDELLLLCY